MAVTVSALLLAIGGLLRGFAQLAAGVISPLLRAYYDHQIQTIHTDMGAALDRGDLDGARVLRERLLQLQRQRAAL